MQLYVIDDLIEQQKPLSTNTRQQCAAQSDSPTYQAFIDCARKAQLSTKKNIRRSAQVLSRYHDKRTNSQRIARV